MFRVSVTMAVLSGAVIIGVVACSQSPTEPSPTYARGTLVLKINSSCSQPGETHLLVDNAPVGTVAIPGETRFTVPAGQRHLLFERNGALVIVNSGHVLVPEAGEVTLTNPPGVCGPPAP